DGGAIPLFLPHPGQAPFNVALGQACQGVSHAVSEAGGTNAAKGYPLYRDPARCADARHGLLHLWVGSTVQGGLYNLFGSIGAVVDFAAVIALALLAYFVREHARPGYRLALAAALQFALALILWWVLVYPVNVELAKWVNGPVPSDWTAYRARWEWGHAVI